MTKREQTPEERELFTRIVQPRESVLDDPEWRRRDNERFQRQRELDEEMRRTNQDPYFAALRRAAGATGGESCNPDRADTESSEEGR